MEKPLTNPIEAKSRWHADAIEKTGLSALRLFAVSSHLKPTEQSDSVQENPALCFFGLWSLAQSTTVAVMLLCQVPIFGTSIQWHPTCAAAGSAGASVGDEICRVGCMKPWFPMVSHGHRNLRSPRAVFQQLMNPQQRSPVATCSWCCLGPGGSDDG